MGGASDPRVCRWRGGGAATAVGARGAIAPLTAARRRVAAPTSARVEFGLCRGSRTRQAPPQCNTRTCGRPRGGSAERGRRRRCSSEATRSLRATATTAIRLAPRAGSARGRRSGSTISTACTHARRRLRRSVLRRGAGAPCAARGSRRVALRCKGRAAAAAPGQSMREMEAAAADEGLRARAVRDVRTLLRR